MKDRLKNLSPVDEMRLDLAFRTIYMFSGHIRDLLILYGIKHMPDNEVTKMHEMSQSQSSINWGNSLN